MLTEEAYERLRTIGESTELGSGFKIAMRDLEIRGAGNLLGESQSGHIAAVGYDLYCQMVTEAVSEMKGEPQPDAPAEIKLDVPTDAYLPTDYVEKEELRLEAYRRLAAVTSAAEVDDIRTEWEDRYGPLPEPAVALLHVGYLRAECHRLGDQRHPDLRVGVDGRHRQARPAGAEAVRDDAAASHLQGRQVQRGPRPARGPAPPRRRRQHVPRRLPARPHPRRHLTVSPAPTRRTGQRETLVLPGRVRKDRRFRETWAGGTRGGSVRRVNRRLSLVLSVAAVAALTAGCSTFSDSSNVARVGDVTLTNDDFQAQLTELDAPSDQLLPADAVRAQITTWIQEQVAADDSAGVDADEAAALYDAGIESGGTICINGIVVETEDTATPSPTTSPAGPTSPNCSRPRTSIPASATPAATSDASPATSSPRPSTSNSSRWPPASRPTIPSPSHRCSTPRATSSPGSCWSSGRSPS